MGGREFSPLAATNLPTGSVLIARYPGSRPFLLTRLGGGHVKKPEKVMEILEADDFTGSFRHAAALVGCDHKASAAVPCSDCPRRDERGR
jgi:hypothetical protein